MSTAGSTLAVRRLIARSNRLYLDSNTLRYFTGFLKTESVPAAVVRELLQQNELETLGVDTTGIVSMKLTADAYHEIITQQKVREAQRTHWQWIAPMLLSGVQNDEISLHVVEAQPILGLKATNNLLRRLITATTAALDEYRSNPDLPGQSIRLPGYLFAIEAREQLDSGEHVQPAESVEVQVFINAANGQYTFGMPWHGMWIHTLTVTMERLLYQMTHHPVGTLSKSTLKAGHRLSRDPLVKERIRHPDEEDAAVIETMKSHGKAKADAQIS